MTQICEHEISKRAKSCPSCGAPQKKRISPVTKLLVIIIFASMGTAIFSGAGGTTSYTGSNAHETPSRAASTSESQPASKIEMFVASPAKALAWMERDQFMIEAMLQDADSARFEDVSISFMKDSAVSCGKVNPKNSLDGYTDFKEFIAAKSLQKCGTLRART